MLIELIPYIYIFICNSGRRDRMVVGFTTGMNPVLITAIVVSLNPTDDEVMGRTRGEKRIKLFLYDSAINIRIISYLLTKKEKKGKKKGKKGKNLFCFVCMILLLIYKNIHVFMLGN